MNVFFIFQTLDQKNLNLENTAIIFQDFFAEDSPTHPLFTLFSRMSYSHLSRVKEQKFKLKLLIFPRKISNNNNNDSYMALYTVKI